MKGSIFLLMITLFTAGQLVGASNPDKAFGNDALEVAQTQAWRQGKMIVVDFTADWCLPCKMMDEYTFSNPKVIDVLRGKFVSVQYDIESFDGIVLKDEYSIKSLPTVLVLHPDGTELKRMQGSMSASELLAELSSVRSTHRIEKQEHYGVERPPLKPKKQKVESKEENQMVLQLGLFSKPENAQELMAKMPLPTRVVAIEKDGRGYYLVLSERSGPREELHSLKMKLQEDGIPCFFTKAPA